MMMRVSDEWWKKNRIGAETGEKGAVEIEGKYLTNVEHVEVLPPPGRDQNNPDCHIYGEVSFNVGHSGDPVTLFSRERDNPDPFDLSARKRFFLSLTDRHESERPLPAVSSSSPLYVTMKLYEKRASSEEEDELIADFTNFEYYHYDPYGIVEYCADFGVEGLTGFRFYPRYSVVFGARAEVEIRIKEEEEGGGGGSIRKIPVWGHVGADQYLEEPSPSSDHGVSFTTLLDIPPSDAETYNVGEPIELERRFVVAPVQYGQYLCISLGLVIDNEAPGVDHDLYFPVMFSKRDAFLANENLTHTKEVKHVPGTVFSVSLKFVHRGILVF